MPGDFFCGGATFNIRKPGYLSGWPQRYGDIVPLTGMVSRFSPGTDNSTLLSLYMMLYYIIMIICGKCSAVNLERRNFCSECGSLIVSFCKKCGFNNLVSDKYCGGCGVSFAAQTNAAGEEPRVEPATEKYSAADLRELTDSRSDVKSGKTKKKSGADEEQVSQDAVNEMFNSRNEE